MVGGLGGEARQEVSPVHRGSQGFSPKRTILSGPLRYDGALSWEPQPPLSMGTRGTGRGTWAASPLLWGREGKPCGLWRPESSYPFRPL